MAPRTDLTASAAGDEVAGDGFSMRSRLKRFKHIECVTTTKLFDDRSDAIALSKSPALLHRHQSQFRRRGKFGLVTGWNGRRFFSPLMSAFNILCTKPSRAQGFHAARIPRAGTSTMPHRLHRAPPNDSDTPSIAGEHVREKDGRARSRVLLSIDTPSTNIAARYSTRAPCRREQ